MDTSRMEQVATDCWRIEPEDGMHVPGLLFASRELVEEMDDKVREQVCNVARLPGIVGASYAMPDAHWGYGFPIGGVAAFDPEEGGVISAGGVGFDISCGVRALATGLTAGDIESVRADLADDLFDHIPAGVGSTGSIRLDGRQMTAMLAGGARWAVQEGWGHPADLERTEERGCMAGADPDEVSDEARRRQRDEMGTLGSGNHYLEVQRVAEIFDEAAAQAMGLAVDGVVVSIHCGSRGMGHQIGTEFLKRMVLAAPEHGIELPDRELACAPVRSDLGQAYLGAMRAGINCALANRQIITHLTREVLERHFPGTAFPVLYDVSHNTCKVETHEVDGAQKALYVHRKGATRALGPGHESLPADLREVGQPVLIGGTMGTTSWVLAGTAEGQTRALASACHGAGRRMSRHAAKKQWNGRQVRDELASRGITVKGWSLKGIAEEAPGAYKDVDAVVKASERSGLARRVARLEPMVCVKG